MRQEKQLSQSARAVQEWHKPSVIDVLHCMCAPLLRPAVTHQSSGHAWGKYEVIDRLSGRAAAIGISLSLTHTDCSFHARYRSQLHRSSVKDNQQERLADANLPWLNQWIAAGDKHYEWLLWR